MKPLPPFLQAIHKDWALDLEQEAKDLWIKDLQNPFRKFIRPLLQGFFALLLHMIWFLKRLPFFQFSSHKFLQKTICWFCKHFVSYEANTLILRHFATESNLLNFLRENELATSVDKVNLYPLCIDDMMEMSFVKHDQELFRCFAQIDKPDQYLQKVSWNNWTSLKSIDYEIIPKFTQILDFETAHALFMCLFCFLLTSEEYRGAINGFNLDQSIAIRVGKIIGRTDLCELAYNKHPLYTVGPWNLSQRFLMHGFFTEYLYATLENLRLQENH